MPWSFEDSLGQIKPQIILIKAGIGHPLDKNFYNLILERFMRIARAIMS